MPSITSVSLLTLLTLLASTPPAEYFPAHLFGEDPIDDEAAARVASKYLREISEPSLFSSMSTEEEVYRLLYLPPLDPALMVRVVRSDPGAEVTVGAFPDRTSEASPSVTEFTIGSSAWHCFQELLNESDFWTTLENDPTPAGILVLDASRWILEGRRDGRYKAIQRTPPDLEEDSDFLELAAALLELGRFDLEELQLELDPSPSCISQARSEEDARRPASPLTE